MTECFAKFTFHVLDLGNRSLQKIQELIAANSQPNLGLILDLHNNNLGAVSVVHVSHACSGLIMV